MLQVKPFNAFIGFTMTRIILFDDRCHNIY